MKSNKFHSIKIIIPVLLAVIQLIRVSHVHADDPSKPVTAENGIVATQQYLATKAGLEVLKEGGNAVSNTYTLNFGYGTSITTAGTEILLNNEMDDFSAKPGSPNADGLLGGTFNAIEPRSHIGVTQSVIRDDDTL